MKSSRTLVIALSCVLLLTVLAARVQAMPPLQCHQAYIGEIPLQVRKVCVALSTLYEVGSAMENYVNDRVPMVHQGNVLMESGVKRQDADHVFLRFGRSITDKEMLQNALRHLLELHQLSQFKSNE